MVEVEESGFSSFGTFVLAFAGLGFAIGCLCQCWVRKVIQSWSLRRTTGVSLRRSIDDLPSSKEERAGVQRSYRATRR